MVPSNEQIDELMAVVFKREGYLLPHYCYDLATLPDVLVAVMPYRREFDDEIGRMVVGSGGHVSAWSVLRLPMRSIVIAALRALGRWPADWQAD